MKNGSPAVTGPGFFGLLGLLFIGLKLAGYISWSWWWVLAPLWGPFVIVVIVVAIIIFSAAAFCGVRIRRKG